jgi:hypothetical protein
MATISSDTEPERISGNIGHRIRLPNSTCRWRVDAQGLPAEYPGDARRRRRSADADFNGDGLDDAADFLFWQQNLGLAEGATNEQGDADGNATVNDLDLVTWQTNFGAGVTPPPISAIPEPAAATLAALAMLAGATLRKRN